MLTAAPDRVGAGAAFMLAFSVLAPTMDMFAKLASAEASPGLIAFARFAIQGALVAAALAWAGRLRLPPRGDFGIHAARGALLAASTLFFFAALAVMPMADVLAIFFVEPLLLTLLSSPMLGERVGWRRLAACGVGLLGALLVIRPGFAAVGWMAAAPLAAALCFALYLALTRRHARRLDPAAMQLWSGLAGAAAMAAALALGAAAGVPALAVGGFGAATAAAILGMGIAGALAHLAVAAAFARAPAAVLAPLQYLEIVAATTLGWLVFGDFPGGAVWAGLAVIVGAGLYVLHRERALARRSDTPLTP